MTDTHASSLHLGSHGEHYGNWMSPPVLVLFGTLAGLSAVLSVLALVMLRAPLLALLCSVVTAALLALVAWMIWIHRQYAFDGGGIMEQVHEALLTALDFDGEGTILDVGCGSGALSIRAALAWPQARVIGVDQWQKVYGYSQQRCTHNAASEGGGGRCLFLKDDARKLSLPDNSVDAVISNYVFHNITGIDKQALVRESLRVLKKGGVFAINDTMKPRLYGNLDTFAQSLRAAGFSEVRIIDTSKIFGNPLRATLLMLGSSKMLVGRK